MLAVSRFLLGMGEGGGFPAATRVVAEWFPVHERATGMGIINAGTAIGALVAPPLIALTLAFLNWRWIFFLTGSIGLLWTVWWRIAYFPPEQTLDRRRNFRTTSVLDCVTSSPRGLGTDNGKVSERRGVVFLSFLAAKIFVRRPRIRYQSSRHCGVGSLTRHLESGCLVGVEVSSSYLVQKSSRWAPREN